LAPRFDLDPATLQRAYLARSAAAHPDLTADPAAPDLAAALNHARQTLEDPESRAEALLAALGGPGREADRSLPDGFLAQIMAVREELEEAVAAKDEAASSRLGDWANERRKHHIGAVGEAFAALTCPPPPPTPTPPTGDLRAIRRELNAWRYIERMLEQLRA